MLDTLTEGRTADSREEEVSTVFHQIEPLEDQRWSEFLRSHPQASVFHSPEWLEALRRTYGYASVVYTTAPPGEALHDGVVFCRVESWLTGRRLVSVPFSDHCAPLVDGEESVHKLIAGLGEKFKIEKWRYIEMRPLSPISRGGLICCPASTYTLHQLDLGPDLDTLFDNFHRDSIQRKIRRAEREGLDYQEGSTQSLLDRFYELLVITRRRHGVPPQPKSWFYNLADCFGEALKVRLALKDNRPVAGMVTIRYKDTLVYKYGGADPRFNNLGGMQMLYWKSIQEAKNSGLRVFDLGRSDADQAGLITFKRRWGAAQSTLTYVRFTALESSGHMFDANTTSWKMRIAKQVFAHAPTNVLSAMGRFLYKHVG